MNVVAGASELVSIHRLDAIEWVKENTKNGAEMFARNFALRDNYKNVLGFITKLQDDYDIHVTQYDGTVALVRFYKDEIPKIPILLIVNRSHDDIWVYAYSTQRHVVDDLKKKYGKNEKRLKLNWWYPTEGGGFDEHEIDFIHNIEIRDEFYPFIPGGIRNYFTEYMASEAPVLLLIGEPGTGKTSFIRHLINEHKLETVVSYDDRVMSSDRFYINFLTSENKKLMVIEDADMLLRKRSEDKNPIMSKLLNISNGVVQLGHKKMVFSTNIDSLNDVDEALVRPGRCFDIVDFRRLTPQEAVAAALAAGMPPLEEPYKRDYTLAEIFNRRKMNYRTHGMGFIR